MTRGDDRPMPDKAPDHAKLRKLAGEATAGPWLESCPTLKALRRLLLKQDAPRVVEDVAYIAAANPQAVLALLDERESYAAEVDRQYLALRAERDQLAAQVEKADALADRAAAHETYCGWSGGMAKEIEAYRESARPAPKDGER